MVSPPACGNLACVAVLHVWQSASHAWCGLYVLPLAVRAAQRGPDLKHRDKERNVSSLVSTHLCSWLGMSAQAAHAHPSSKRIKCHAQPAFAHLVLPDIEGTSPPSSRGKLAIQNTQCHVQPAPAHLALPNI